MLGRQRSQADTIHTGVAQRDASKDLSAAATLDVHDYRVHGTVNTANGDYTVTLPNVAEANGQMISIRVTVANVKTLTLEDNNNEAIGWTDLVFDTDDDHAVLWSDGERWHVLVNGIA